MGSVEGKGWMLAYLDNLNVTGLGRALYMLAAAVFVAVVYYELTTKRKERIVKLPPGPFQFPYLGCLPQFLLTAGVRSSSKFRDALAAAAIKHGPAALIQLVDHHILLVSNGELAKEVLVGHDAEFFYRPRSGVGKYLGFGYADIAFSEGRHHWYMRKLCDTKLFSPECFTPYSPIYKRQAAKMLHSVFASGESLSIRETVASFVRNSMYGMFLGTAHEDIENTSIHFTKDTLTMLLDEVVSVAGEITLSDVTPGLAWLDVRGRQERLKDLNVKLTKYFQAILDDRSNRSDPPEALVDVLLALTGEDKISNEAIMGILLDSLVGGIYPITATVEWAMTELVRHPALLERVQMEITDVVGPYHIVEEAEFSQLSFFQAIVKETLRLHPAVPLSLPHTNKVRTPFTARYEMPANTSVLIDYAAIGRDPEVWGAKPLHFDPRRFTETDAASQIDTFKLLPFGYGRRGCPGANLGVILVQLALAYLVQGFDWLPSKGLLPHDVHTLEAPGVFSFRSEPLIVRATPRLSSKLYEV